MTSQAYGAQNLTRQIVEKGLAQSFAGASVQAQDMARYCLIDWLGVSIGGIPDPVCTIVTKQALWDGGRPESSMVGQTTKVPAAAAALVNGTLSHALDYDDVNRAMNGHPTAPVLAAALAMAQANDATGEQLMTALVAGYETECRVGALVYPEHYRMGFHATATIGSFGAAMAAARILKLDIDQTEVAMGIAGTQAAGLKSMFGSMCKPFHAGKAAQNGVTAARLAAAGFTSAPDVLACRDGFSRTHSSVFNPEAALAEPTGGYHLNNNLFKYHAACYRTHASINAALQLKEAHGFSADDVAQATIRIATDADKICNIAEPVSGLEVKFSLRATAAIALLGFDTAAIETYSDEVAVRPDVIAMRDKVTVELHADMEGNHSVLDITLTDGRQFSASCRVGIPEPDLALLHRRIDAKFEQLVAPVLGSESCAKLLALCKRVETLTNLGEIMRLFQTANA